MLLAAASLVGISACALQERSSNGANAGSVGRRWLELSKAAADMDTPAVRSMTYEGMTLEEWLAFGIEPHASWSITGTISGTGQASANTQMISSSGSAKLLAALEVFAPHSHQAVDICRRLVFDQGEAFAENALSFLVAAADNSVPTRDGATRALITILATDDWRAVRKVLGHMEWVDGLLVTDKRLASALPLATALVDAHCEAWRRLLADPGIPREVVLEDLDRLHAQNREESSMVGLQLEVEGRVRWLSRHNIHPDQIGDAQGRIAEIAQRDTVLADRVKVALHSSWARWLAEPRSIERLHEGLLALRLGEGEFAAAGWSVLLARADLTLALLVASAWPIEQLVVPPPVEVGVRQAYTAALLRLLRSHGDPVALAATRDALVDLGDHTPRLLQPHMLALGRTILEHPDATLTTWCKLAKWLQGRPSRDAESIAALLRGAVARVDRLAPTPADFDELVTLVEAGVGSKAKFNGPATATLGFAELLLAAFPQSPTAWRCRAYAHWRLGERAACTAALAKARQLAIEQQVDFEIVTCEEAQVLFSQDAPWTAEARRLPL